jgi:DNA helicase IV
LAVEKKRTANELPSPKNSIEREQELSSSEEIGREQKYVDTLYDRLDGLREHALRRQYALLRQSGSTPSARTERDSSNLLYTGQIAQYDAVEHGLCFGRLDFDDGHRRYVGRIGIFDEDAEYEPLLLDWRAPAARPFYVATAVSPGGVTRRRHIRTRLRQVVGLDDEVLDLGAADHGPHEVLIGEAALLSALGASRTGRMRDIVETIQVEQDAVIRSDLNGVLVVQGGPGTGKTAVALHRAAYLLYTYRERLSKSGVLIVGPNTTFLRYISQVLPSLAETGVLLATVADLYPGLTADRDEPVDTAELKGRAMFADVLAAAVRDRQRVPDDALEVTTEAGETLRLDGETCARARERARRTLLPHNLARPVFAELVVDALARQLADRLGDDPYFEDPLGGDDAPGVRNVLDEADVAAIRAELRGDEGVGAALDAVWPVLTPQRLLDDLFAAPDAIASAAPQLSTVEREALRREPGGGWTPADVALLDEAAELLGDDESAARERAERLHRARIAYAQGVLDVAMGSVAHESDDDGGPEFLTVKDVLTASQFAERHAERALLTAAQRAAADRTWAFGHVIVDEAQELSPMTWRLLMRRCPSRSMTVVGDVSQTGDPAGTSSWQRVLAPYVADRWRLTELTVNYRTPAEIMAVAAEVLAAIDPSSVPPRSVRATGAVPRAVEVEPDGLVALVRAEADAVGDGRLGVIVPSAHSGGLGRAIADAVPDAAVGDQPDLDHTVAVLTVRQAKGLEFDAVVVVDPADIVAGSARGLSDLYVALTRTTQRLTVVTRDAE